MKVLLLSRYGTLGASSRLRSYQYLPYLDSAGWRVDVAPLFANEYLAALYDGTGHRLEAARGYWRRLKALTALRKYDLIWIEKEIFPFMPAGMERLLAVLDVPYVVDYDDALFHRYDCHSNWLVRRFLGRKIDAVMRNAAVVIAGNEYLAARARAAGAGRVEIVPTVIDLERYNLADPPEGRPFTIGWIGSPVTSRYLQEITSSLSAICKSHGARIVAVGASREALSGLDTEIISWAEDSEVEAIQSFDVGIMPLPDEPWEQGKCGYKLIQYMACGLPVVASPVGVNSQIVTDGVNGFLVESLAEWEEALTGLARDAELRRVMGLNGRKLVEDEYCLQVQAPKLESILCEVAKMS